MTSFKTSAATLLLFSAALGGCQRPPPPTHAEAAARADCRVQVERQYNAQNRADLTRRDERDFAYAGSYNTGIPSRGLSAEFQRDQMESDCLRSRDTPATPATPTAGPASNPANRGTTGSSLQP